MAQITLRLSEEIQEMLKYEAIRQGKSQNTVITDVLTNHLGKNRDALDNIKRAVVLARAKGRRSTAESLQLAEKAAALDDAEGLGTIKVTRHKTKRLFVHPIYGRRMETRVSRVDQRKWLANRRAKTTPCPREIGAKGLHQTAFCRTGQIVAQRDVSGNCPPQRLFGPIPR